MPKVERAYPADYPPARGHFPENPVIPGAALLSDTVDVIAAALGADASQLHLAAAKFPAFARPGEVVTIDYSGTRERGARFECSVAGRIVLTGSVTWGPAASAA